MTRRATGQLNGRPNFSFLRELHADFRLIIRRLPIHVVNLIERAQGHLRITMAIEAPLHQERVCLKNQGHLIHRAVTRRAANSLTDVNAVIEIRKVTKAVDLHPLNRFVRSITLAHGLQIADVIEQNRMAIHASFGGRDTGCGGIFDRSVTIAAVNSIVARVMLVTELYRLLAGNILPRKIGRARKCQYPS